MKNRTQAKGFTPLQISSVTGFTLMELTIASLLIALTAGGMFLLLGGATQLSYYRNHRYEAHEYAGQTSDSLRDYVTANPGPPATPNPIYQLAGDVLNNCTGAVLPARYALLQLGGANRHCHPLPAGAFRDQFGGFREYQVTNLDLNGDTIVDLQRVAVRVYWREKR